MPAGNSDLPAGVTWVLQVYRSFYTFVVADSWSLRNPAFSKPRPVIANVHITSTEYEAIK